MANRPLKLLKTAMIEKTLKLINLKQGTLLVVVIVLALALRVFSLDRFPAGFNADEAAIGYNAYSIINTGKDEYGEFLPLSFKSFGDYKPGLYFYFVIPFVAALGLNEWAVRLPSALLGTGLVMLIYFLAKEIFKDRKISFFTAVFLAINPWAIHFSRGGWETNAATFFIILGVLLLIKSFNKKFYLFWSLLSFLVSMYLYQSPRLVVPAFLVPTGIIFHKEILKGIRKNARRVSLGFVVLAILTIPIILQFVSGSGSARFTGLSFLSDPGPATRVNELRGQHQNPNDTLAKSSHNKLTVYFSSFLGHYLDHYSADFLFIDGDPLVRNKVPEVGQFYLIQAVFLIFGAIFLIKLESKLKYLLLVWILVAPLASSMTYQTPHAVRALSLVVPLTLVMAFGFVGMLRLIKIRKVKLIVGILLLVILSFEFVRYLESFYILYPKRYPLSWEYGFSEMISKVQKYKNDFYKVVITDRYDQPYILTLFYEKYDPTKYQPQAVLSERDKFNFGTVRAFDKYEFHKITQEEIRKYPNVLFIATPEEAGEGVNEIDAVYFPNGEKAFVFIKS